MDVIYIGDISTDFKYAVFGSNYIDLYDRNYILPNTSATYYRIYFYDNTFVYSTLSRSANYNGYNVGGTEVQVTNNVWYRRDIDSILLSVLVIAVFGAFFINLVTSIVKKGGLLSGLL